MRSKRISNNNFLFNIKLVLTCIILLVLFCVFPIDVKAIHGSNVYEFSYSGNYEVFTVPKSGWYRLETWGAQGGYRTNSSMGGKGGYSKGEVYLERGQELYVYVGGFGKTHGGWNGGGFQPVTKQYGGGATDIRIGGTSLYHRIIVAGGGGTDGATGIAGGAGGGYWAGNTSGGCGSGGNAASMSGAGSHRASFGIGGDGASWSGGHAGAGGGGWYGGGGADPDGSGDDDKGGGGGSGFAWSAQNATYAPSGYKVPTSLYMTNLSFGTGSRSGDGFARITELVLDGITSIEINRGTVPIDFKYNKYTYYLTVDNDVENVRFNIETEDDFTLTQSNRSTDMTTNLSVTNIITLTDNETGLVTTYTVNVRKQNYYLANVNGNVRYNYSYTGETEKFYVPATGIYTIQTWGAQGGYRNANYQYGGRGGYSSADMYLVKGEVLYVNVGGQGNTISLDGKTKGWNGGGYATGYYANGGQWYETTNIYGGGASDVRYGGNTLYNRVVVAGGGGAVGATGYAGAPAWGSSGTGCGSGGTAGGYTAGGTYRATFGRGGDGGAWSGGYAGAGGGGWYGGGGANPDGSGDDDKGGGGGSGFAFTSGLAQYVPSGYLVTSKNYLTNATLLGGGSSFPSPSGSNETGHGGNGYVRISPKLINGVQSVTINDGEVPIDFDYTVYTYYIPILDSVENVNVSFILNDGYSMVESYQGSYVLGDKKDYVYSVDVINDITGLTVNYTIHFKKQSGYLMSGTTGSYGYSYNGYPQKFVAPAAGIYTFEAWGAQGGHRGANNGGRGGYSTGQMFLNKGQIVYVYVGSNGNNKGWNGGGYQPGIGIYGGGASDIRVGGQSLYNRVLVAGGGGSVGASGNYGGVGGGTTGGYGVGSYGALGTPGTQTSPGGGGIAGSFGIGGNGYSANGGHGGAGGGGWYGGGGSTVDGSGDDDRSGAGGSGFVWTSDTASYVPDAYLVSENYFLMSAKTIAGNAAFPNINGTGNETGHAGNGFVKISFSLSYDFDITVSDNVTLDKEFDYDIKEYVGTLSTNDSSLVNFNVSESDSILKVVGDGTQEIHVGDNTFNIVITYVNGAVETFTYHIYREANNIDYLNNIYFDEHPLSEFNGGVEFNKDTLEYNLTLPYNMDEYELTVDKGSADQIITNLGHVINKNNSYSIPISVTNETGNSTRTYILNITLPHSSALKKITFTSSGDTVIEFPIEEGKTEFDIDFESYIASMIATPEVYDGEASAVVTGDGYIEDDEYIIEIDVTEPHVDPTHYVLHIRRITVSGYEKGLTYNGNVQTVIIPYSHEYLLQAWGAQGGRGGGRGGYSYGSVFLEKGTVLYVYTGGSGDSGGFNGGGTSKAGYGGGASDIRVGTDSLYSRVIIAGGGGGHGSDGCAAGGVGGGLSGGGSAGQGSCGTQAGGGTQLDAGAYGQYGNALGNKGKFGRGANAPSTGGSYYGGGGGGGFYGGGSGSTAGWSNGGGGGSGYVYTTETASSVERNTNWLLDENYYLTDAATLSGSNHFVSPSGSMETGHSGNGYTKISIPYQNSENNFLKGIVSNKGIVTPEEWDYDETTYYLNLSSSDVEINIEGIPADGKASVVGNGNYVIEAGTTEINLIVTSESGHTRTYTLIVIRDADSNPNPKNISVNGMLEQYCSLIEGACDYSFDVDVHEYDITVPYQIREIVMVVNKGHYFQTVNGDGLYALNGGMNDIVINITSEDQSSSSEYVYHINRDMTGNADLRVLRLTDPEYELNYSYNVSDYYVTIPHEKETVTLEAIADDPNATVNIVYPDGELDYGTNVVSITVTAQNGVTKEYRVFVNRLESNNAFLNELVISNITDGKDEIITPTPEFNKMNLTYNMVLENDVTKIKFDGVAEDEFASIEGLGEYELNVGNNTIKITVVAQDESKLTYTFNVNRKANANALLSSLSMDEHAFTEAFESEKFVYYVYVTGEITTATINATPEKDTSTYQIIGNTSSLVAGKNEIVVRVTAEDGTQCDYRIIINRTGYNDSTLLTLDVTNGIESYTFTPPFDPLYDTYSLNLPNDVTNVILTATSDAAKRVKIGSSSVFVKKINLLTDNPSVTSITVTAEDGTVTTYNVTITRELSSDNSLDVLEVADHELIPNFESDVLNYSFTTYEHSLSISAIPTNRFAKVVISDNYKNLVPGENTITIDVTSETGDKRTYTLTVTRELSSDNTLKELSIRGNQLIPDFDPTVDNYSFVTSYEGLDISAIPNNKYASVEILGNIKPLNEGLNVIEIKVTAENGDIKYYTISVTRVLDDNSFLSNLTTNEGINETFDKEVLDYTLTTESESISIIATLESEFSKYDILDSDSNKVTSMPTNLKLGDNVFSIVVTAQNGLIKTYNLTITRNLRSDAKLKGLSPINENFVSTVYNYTYTTTEHEVTITPVLSDELHATYKIFNVDYDEVSNKVSLNTGSNVFLIQVTAEDGTVLIYNYVVTRNPKDIATIESVSFETSPKIDKDNFVYSVTTDETSLNFDDMVLTDPYSTVLIDGNSDFVNGEESIVTVIVTSESGKVKNIYTFNVTKVISHDSTLKNIKLGEYELSPKFNRDTLEYEVFVPNDLQNVTLEAYSSKNTSIIKSILLDSEELVTSYNKDFNESITMHPIADDPIITILVEAEDGTTSTYKLNVLSEDLINNYLKTLTVSCGELNPVFDKKTQEYVVYIPDDQTTCTVEGVSEVNIATVTGNGEYTLPLDQKSVRANIEVTSARGEKRVYTVRIRRGISSESRLSDLSIKGYSFDIPFDPDTFEYNVVLPNQISPLDENYFEYTLMDEDATIDFPSLDLVTNVVNKYVIVVTAEDGVTKSAYTINVTRTKSDDTTLNTVDVIVGSETITCTIDADTKSCTVDVPADTSDFEINAHLSNNQSVNPANISKHVFNSADYTKTVELKVIAENGVDFENYTVNLNRLYSDNNDLMSIEVNYVPLDGFSSSKLTYNKTVMGTLSQVMISVTLADSKATVVTDLSQPFALNYGINPILITVRSESGIEKTYAVNIKRSDSEDAMLSHLEVKNYPFEEKFDPEETEYTLRVPRSKKTLTKSEIIYSLSDPDSTITLDNKLDIDFTKQYNIYNATVTAGNGVVRKTYHINVLPELETINTIDYVIIDDNIVKDSDNDNIINYDIFDDESEATLTDIKLSGEYAEHAVRFPTKLNYGTPFTFTVLAENGTVRTYTINLVRTKTRELKLSNIVANFEPTDDCDGICNFNTAFNSDTLEYTIYVPNELTSLEDLVITPKNNLQTYKVLGNSSFDVGENIVIVRTENSLGETLDYVLHVFREANSDPNLLGINFITPQYDILEFDENNYEYFVEFNAISSGNYELEFDKKHSGQTVKVTGAKVLYFGKNDIIVQSKSESCSTSVKTRAGCNQRDYVIHAYRNEEYSNLLNALTVSNGNSGDLLQTFNKYKFDYTFTVDSEISMIKLEGIAVDEAHTTVTGNGEFKLKMGYNSFKIIVNPETGNPAVYTVNIIRDPSSNVNLENLTVMDYEMTPEFDKNTVDYYVNIPATVSSLDIRYTKEDSESTVLINGNNNFVTGENLVKVIVLSADKTRGKTYNIYVTRERSTVNTLNGISVSSEIDSNIVYYPINPAFAPDTNEYTFNVPHNISNVNVEVTKGHPDEFVTGDGDYALEYGENIVDITVTSEAGTVNHYQVTINREFNFSVENLRVVNGDNIYPLNPLYSDTIDEYSVSVANDIDNVDVLADLLETLNDVDGLGNHTLKTGNNDILITISYGEKGSRTITIHVDREKSNDASLAELSVAEGVIDPIFESNKYDYAVEIPYEYESATILYKTNEENATVEIKNNTDLEVGVPKTIEVIVTAENGDKQTYTITATRLPMPSASNKLTDMYIDEGTFNPLFNMSIMNYSTDVSKDTKRVTLHVRAEEPRYSTVQVYKRGSSVLSTIDMSKSDPSILLNVDYGKNTFIIKVTNYEGSIRNYQLDIYRSGPNEARIKSLAFNVGTLSPYFDKNKNAYTMSVDTSVSSVFESVVMVDPLASYTITGNKNLKAGDNTITIKTTAQDGVTHLEYTIIVNKQASDNAFLSDIVTFPEKDFEFNKTKYSYTYHVPANTNSVQVIGIREDSKAKITGNGIYTLEDNKDRVITLTVTAESGNVKTYTITVTRSKDNNNFLESLTTNEGVLVPEFDKEKDSYEIEVENYVDTINLTGKPESSKATVTGNGLKNLTVGSNKFQIVVTAEDGSIRTYFITVIRKESESAKTSLDDLVVVEGEINPKFSPEILNYTVNIPYEYDTATILYTAHNINAIVDISGNTDLVVGSNLVTVKVTLNDEYTVYTINVVKQDPSNTYLSDLSVIDHTINPEFNKETMNYSLNVSSKTESISVKGVPELSTSKVYLKVNNSEYKLITDITEVELINGKNEIMFKVLSSSNAERVYKLIVTKNVSDDNKLLTLNTNIGTINPEFDPDTNDYRIEVPVGTESITLTGTVSKDATVSGLDTYNVIVGEETHFITVTSQSGIINTYSVKVVREANNDATITNIVPSVSNLNPSFTLGVKNYNMEVEGDVDSISFAVNTADKNATVIGNNATALFNGPNTITITSIAEDGITTETVTIIVTRKVDIISIDVEPEIDIPIGNDYQLNVILNPTDTYYTGLTYRVDDSSVLTINSDGLITPKKIGDTRITITSTRKPSLVVVTTIHVINPEIQSDVYVINRDIGYVTGMEVGDTIEDFINNFKNDKETLSVVDSSEENVLDAENTVATRYIVKLIINGTTYDELTLVLKGDIDGDGDVSVADVTKIRNVVLRKITFDAIEHAAGDIDIDSDISVADVTKTRNFVLKKVSTLNTDLYKSLED